MIYSLIKTQALNGKAEYALVKGISRYTLHTKFYDIVDGVDSESLKSSLIKSFEQGCLISTPNVVSVLKNKKTGTNTIL